MSAADTLTSLTILWFFAVITPGPNVVLFAGLALSAPIGVLMAATTALLIGTAAWMLAGLFGLFWLFEAFPALGRLIGIIGGGYLCLTGLRLLAGSLRPAEAVAATSPQTDIGTRQAFFLGLATSTANPKSLMFISSLFAATRLAEQPLPIGLAGVAIMLAMSVANYAAMGAILRLVPRGGWMDRLSSMAAGAAGLVMVGYGARMMLAL